MTTNYASGYFFDLGAMPGELALVFTKGQWNSLMRKMGLSPEEYPYDFSAAGRCTYIVDHRLTEPLCIVSLMVEPKRTEPQIVGIIAHEVTHALQYTLRYMEGGGTETQPRHWEVEAYFIQYFTQAMYKAWRNYSAEKGRQEVW